jgi:hypothetical protein
LKIAIFIRVCDLIFNFAYFQRFGRSHPRAPHSNYEWFTSDGLTSRIHGGDQSVLYPQKRINLEPRKLRFTRLGRLQNLENLTKVRR